MPAESRSAEPRSSEPLIDRIAQYIRGAVADERLAEPVIKSVARDAADGLLSRGELRRILDTIALGRRAGVISSPGAYFVTCAKDLYARAGVPWLNRQHTATVAVQQRRA